jgi:D-alanine-D-alanine ligase
MNAPMKKVAVLMGGWSAEREVSLVSGRECASALEEAGYAVTHIDVTHDLATLVEALTPAPDVVFNALHGRGGEDGCIQGVLETLRIPYTHSGVLASSIAMDKPMTKRLLACVGIQSPEGMVIAADRLDQAAIPFAAPYVVKPAEEGSSVGVHIVRPGDNRPVIEDFLAGSRLLVERYIPGRELTVGVRGIAGHSAKAMTVTEIRPKLGFYDYETKYTDGMAVHDVPAKIPDSIAAKAKRLAVLAHETLGCSGVSRSDFRWDNTKEDGLYFLEINTQPGMTPLSLVPEQAAYLGISFAELVTWLVEGARCHA